MQRNWRSSWQRAGSKCVAYAVNKNIYLGMSLLIEMKIQLAKKIVRPVVAACFLLGAMNGVNANPTEGQVTTGSGTIIQNGNTMTVIQSTDRLGINWQNFSIQPNEIVNFHQPNVDSVVLNRVIGNQASQIYGQLNANGRVFLVNQNGILFAPGAAINVGGLAASTLNITDDNFREGIYHFTGSSNAAVINQGAINTANGGYAVLLGAQVKNEGMIVAKQGSVALGAGSVMTMDMCGDNLVRLAVDQGSLQALVENKNLIQADAGNVIMTARTANRLAGTVVNNSGIIRARSISARNGSIVLDSGEGGQTINSGALDAYGQAIGQTGGTVKILGDKVMLASDARINVAGDQGGGTALIGGNYRGKGLEQNANQTIVEKNAVITADALTSGNGGKVVVWADDKTVYQGNISAKGGLTGGNGGMTEVSGKQELSYQGNIDLQAVKGMAGSLLLDPKNIVIASSGNSISGDVHFADNTTNPMTISGASLSDAINHANVVLQADNNISLLDTVNASTTNHSLTLQAGNSIILDSNAHVILQKGNFKAVINDESATAVNRDPGSAYFRMYSDTAIVTNGGNINITQGNFNSVQDGYVQLDARAFLDACSIAGGGSIAITGITASGTDKGINLLPASKVITNGNGTISLNGTGRILPVSGTQTDNSGGVDLGGLVESADGDITITGLGRGDGNNNCGVQIDYGTIKTTGSGNIIITGTGTEMTKPGAIGNFGVYIANTGTAIQTANGNITILGVSNGTGNESNHGVILKDGVIVQSTGVGNITIEGTSGQGNNNNYGLQISNSKIEATDGSVTLKGNSQGKNNTNPGIVITGNSEISSLGIAPIALHGTGTNKVLAGSQNYGIWMLGSPIISSIHGSVLLSGMAGDGKAADNCGIRMEGTTLIQSVVDANVTLNGIGGNGTNDNNGVYLQSGDIRTAGGKVLISGIGKGSASYNKGVRVDEHASIEVSGGKISINGTGGNADSNQNNDGIQINGGKISAVNGDITLTGTGGSGSNSNFNVGIRIDNSSNSGLIKTTGNGKISIQGTGGNGYQDNYGMWLQYGSMEVENGAITINSKANGTDMDNYGLRMDPSFAIISLGSGSINILGSGGNGTYRNAGLYFSGGNITANNGDIYFKGIGGAGSTNFNAGILLESDGQIQTTGSGNIVLEGTGGNALHDNYGLLLQKGLISSKDGDIQLTGYGQGVGFKNTGIRVDSTMQLQSTGEGKISLYGIGSAQGTSENRGVLLDQNQINISSSNILISGVGGGNGTADNNAGVLLNGSTFAGGSASIKITGIGGNGINNSEGVKIGDVNLGLNKLLVSADDITLTGNILSSSIGNVVVLAASNHVIDNGTISIGDPSAGRWLVYVPAEGSAIGNGLQTSYSFTQYGTSYNNGSGIIPYDSATMQGRGNGLVYSVPLTFSQSLVGTVEKIYDGNNVAIGLKASNFQISNMPGFNILVSGISSTGIYDSKNVGNNMLVTAAPVQLTVTDTVGKPVYGFASTSASGNIGRITPKTLTAVSDGTISKEYDGTKTAELGTRYALIGLVAGEEGLVSLLAAGGEYNSKDVVSADKVTFDSIRLEGIGAGNYSLVTGIDTFNDNNGNSIHGNITKAKLTIAATANTKIYDGTVSAAAAPSVSGLKGTDTVSDVSEVYSDNKVGTGKRVLVNSYTINDGNSGSNYDIMTIPNDQGVILRRENSYAPSSPDYFKKITEVFSSASNGRTNRKNAYSEDIVAPFITIINKGINSKVEKKNKNLFTLHTNSGDEVNVISIIINQSNEMMVVNSETLITNIDIAGNQMTFNKNLTDRLCVAYLGDTYAAIGNASSSYDGDGFIVTVTNSANLKKSDRNAKNLHAPLSFSVLFDNGQMDTYLVEFESECLEISLINKQSFNIARDTADIGKLVISTGLKVAKDYMGVSPYDIKEVIWNVKN